MMQKYLLNFWRDSFFLSIFYFQYYIPSRLFSFDFTFLILRDIKKKRNIFDISFGLLV